jgi:hypothetical protein
VLGLIAAIVAFAWCFPSQIITTNLGYETVLVSQPLLGDYKVLPKALKPGRSLEFDTIHGVPVKTDKMYFDYRYSDYLGTGSFLIQVKLVVKSNDSVGLVSKFGEFWYSDHVEDILRQAVANVAREYYNGAPAFSAAFQAEFNGRLKYVIQQKFKSAGIPLTVFIATGEFRPYGGSSGSFYPRGHQVAGQGIRYSD